MNENRRPENRGQARIERPADNGRNSGRRTESFNDRDRRQQAVPGTRSSQPQRFDAQRDRNRDTLSRDRSRAQGGNRRDGSYDGQQGARSQQRYDTQYSGQRTQQFDGRISRMEQASGGYRVWLDGGGDHCFWIPESRYLLWPLRIGLTVSFGGFWNPLGYYNVYDYGPTFGGYYGGGYSGGGYYGGGYYGDSYYGGSYSGRPYYGGSYRSRSYQQTSILSGYVDRFDDQAGTFVIRDDSNGRYATVLMGHDQRRFEHLQVGDWVSLSGIWTRSGYFDAYRIEQLDQR